MKRNVLKDRYVSVSACQSYNGNVVFEAVKSALDPFGGIRAFVKNGDTVVLKVNLLMKAPPDKCITTNPEIVRQVGKLCLDAGAKKIIIADSPGGKNTSREFAQKAFTESGFWEVALELGASCEFLSDRVSTVSNQDNKLFKTLPVGSLLLDDVVIINLPKCKTHGLMKFTGAVKNMYGAIPGREKAAFHAKVPDSFDFGDLLIDIYETVRPSLNIMDAVFGMEGEGPSGGSPREIGVILASVNGYCLDAVAEKIIGLDYGESYVTKQAINRGLLPLAFSEILVSENWHAFTVKDYRKANDINVGAFLPKGLQKVVRKHLVAYPILENNRDECISCRICLDNCPVNVITMDSNDNKPVFELGECIRCYCCQELCPKHLIELESPKIGKFLGL